MSRTRPVSVQVHSLISCLQPLHQPEPAVPPPAPTPTGLAPGSPSPLTPPPLSPSLGGQEAATSIFKSTYSPGWDDRGETTMSASLFQSAIDASFWDGTGAHSATERPVLPPGVTFSGAAGPADPRSLHERHLKKLQVSSETLLKAQLSIHEVNISLSSRGTYM